MKKRFSEEKIIKILRDKSEGISVQDLARQYNIAVSTLYKWEKQYGGMNVSQLRELKTLRKEHQKLKSMYAESQLKATVLQEALEEKLQALLIAKNWSHNQRENMRQCSAGLYMVFS